MLANRGYAGLAGEIIARSIINVPYMNAAMKRLAR